MGKAGIRAAHASVGQTWRSAEGQREKTTERREVMAVYKRGGVYWFNFIYPGKRIQKSAKTTSKTVAKIAERDYRDMLERVHAGMPAEKRNDRVKRVGEIVQQYLELFDINHRERTVAINKSCLRHVTRLLGGRLLSD